jgi:biotin carboxyl carrier protein|tara:strand:+ start:218 stop:613 length:396 start_codon:yes stop_codon:yes gene_type:complete
MAEKRKVTVDNEEYEVELEREGPGWLVRIKDKEFSIKVEGRKNKKIRVNKKKKKNTNGIVSSNIPGKVIAINIKMGEVVSEGQVLLILEAMKMQNEITCPIKGIVTEVNCTSGDSIEANTPLIIIEPKEKA